MLVSLLLPTCYGFLEDSEKWIVRFLSEKHDSFKVLLEIKVEQELNRS